MQLIGYFGYLLGVGWLVLRPVAAPAPAVVRQPSSPVASGVTVDAENTGEKQAVHAGALQAEPAPPGAELN
jgi:hypothetical protein